MVRGNEIQVDLYLHIEDACIPNRRNYRISSIIIRIGANLPTERDKCDPRLLLPLGRVYPVSS